MCVVLLTRFLSTVLHEKAVQIETAVTRGDHRSHRVLRLMLGSREGRKQALSVSELVRHTIIPDISFSISVSNPRRLSYSQLCKRHRRSVLYHLCLSIFIFVLSFCAVLD